MSNSGPGPTRGTPEAEPKPMREHPINHTGHQVDTVLLGATRMHNSPNGNPRWSLVTENGIFDTAVDSQSGSDVMNLIPSEGGATPVSIWLEAGRGVVRIQHRFPSGL